MAATIRFGIAGWVYPDWEGIVYPKPKPRGFEPLELIASLVDAVEINASYYSPVSAAAARKWIKIAAPFPQFMFTAKLWQKFTHEKAAWADDDVKIFKRGLAPLFEAGRLSCLLAQFPWSFRNDEQSFERLKKIAEDFKDLPLVVELRHRSWLKDEVLDWLKENKIGFANIDQPLFHDSLPATEIVTGRIGYVRLHGRNKKNWFKKEAESWERYDYLYEKKELEDWSARIKKIAKQPQELYVINNNHYQGKGLANALTLKFIYTRKKQKAPKLLIQKYPDLKDCCLPAEPQRELF